MARFLQSATRVERVPDFGLREVAFLGRSNVGKSTLINKVLGQGVAKTSSKPGHTRVMNFYQLDKLVLVDMPGYGYKSRPEWGDMILDYLRSRTRLSKTMLLVDALHGLKPTDHLMLDILQDLRAPHQIVHTKMDRLSTQAYARNTTALQDYLHLHRPACHPLVLVTHKQLAREALSGTAAEEPSFTAADCLPHIYSFIDQLNYDTAHMFCQRALEKEPNNVEVLELTAQCKLELGDPEAALKLFEKAAKLAPDVGAAKYMYLGQLSSELQAISYFSKGVDLMRIERDQVLKDSDEYKVYNRKMSTALCSMTEIYLTDCCFEPSAEQNCETYLQQAADIDPTNPEVYQLLASVRLSQVRNEEAKQAIENSMSLWMNLEPEHPDIPEYESRIALTKLLLEMSLYQQAFAVLEGLQKEDDQNVHLWYLYGWSFYCLGEDVGGDEKKAHWEDARECLETAQKLYTLTESQDEELLKHVNELINTINSVVPPTEGDEAEAEEDEDMEEDGEWEDIPEQDGMT